MKKKALEMALQQIAQNPRPKSHLEQYPTPANIAADVLFTAHALGDIEKKKVIDLGCGTGIFAIGAKLLGAKEVIGMDIDEEVIEIARENTRKFEIDVDFERSKIKDFNVKCDTVVQNPPFGAQTKHADRPFLNVALNISSVVYSLHLTETQEFIERISREHKAEITHRKRYDFEIRHTFEFHRKEKKYFDVTLFRLARAEGMR
ncbi:MAG: 50S ribosomal protein L11 methyltransferase [Methanomassiliicoccales archaeon]|nr:MAG: 50S ribosomal protein L11 methyltransferase [Methanomassiliicoccales archaeon]